MLLFYHHDGGNEMNERNNVSLSFNDNEINKMKDNETRTCSRAAVLKWG